MIYAFFPILAAICYGLAFAFTEKAMGYINVVTYMILGSILTLAFSCALIFIKAEPVILDFLHDKKQLMIIGVAALAPMFGWFFTVYAIRNISAGYAAFAELSYPLFTLLFLFIFFGARQFDWSILAGGALVLAGSFILVYGQLKTSS